MVAVGRLGTSDRVSKQKQKFTKEIVHQKLLNMNVKCHQSVKICNWTSFRGACHFDEAISVNEKLLKNHEISKI